MFFLITVTYREPSYEERMGPKSAPYQWTFATEAPDVGGAKAEALRQFREVERLSAVGWVRQVVDVFVETRLRLPDQRRP